MAPSGCRASEDMVVRIHPHHEPVVRRCSSVRAWPAVSGDDGAVKRSTAIGHLFEMAEVATERLRLRDTDIGWPLEEMWVTGDLLGFAETLEAGSVVVVLDLPAEELS